MCSCGGGGDGGVEGSGGIGGSGESSGACGSVVYRSGGGGMFISV